MKERFGFGSAYLVFRNAEPVAAFKANTRNKIIDVKDYEGSEKAWRIVKEFAWEHQMPLQTDLRIGGKKPSVMFRPVKRLPQVVANPLKKRHVLLRECCRCV